MGLRRANLGGLTSQVLAVVQLLRREKTKYDGPGKLQQLNSALVTAFGQTLTVFVTLASILYMLQRVSYDREASRSYEMSRVREHYRICVFYVIEQ